MKVSRQCAPSRIGRLDQVYLPRPVPPFDPLFAQDRFLDIGVMLKPDQVMNAVAFGETVCAPFTMLCQPADEIVRDARVKCAVWPVGQDICKICVVAHGSPPSRG